MTRAYELWLGALRARVFTFVRRDLSLDDAEDVALQVTLSLSRRYKWLKDRDPGPYAIACARYAIRSHVNAPIGYLTFARDDEARRALRRAYSVIRQYGYLDLARTLDDAGQVLEAGRGREIQGWLPVRGPPPRGERRQAREAYHRIEQQVPTMTALLRHASS